MAINKLTRKSLKSGGKRTTIKLPTKLKFQMQSKVVVDGFGLRGKSQWVCKAVEELLNREGWTDEIVGDYVLKNDVQDNMVLTDDIVERINDAIPEAIKAYPHLKGGAQSAIIRAAINARIMELGKLKFQ